MAKDFNKGLDVINSMINDEPAEGTRQKEKTVTFAFRTTQKTADMIRSYAYYKNKSVRAVMEEMIAKELNGVELPKREDEEEKEQHD